jgi:hypothetical protein
MFISTSTVYGTRRNPNRTTFVVQVFTGLDAPQRASRLVDNLMSYAKVGHYDSRYWTTTENH